MPAPPGRAALNSCGSGSAAMSWLVWLVYLLVGVAVIGPIVTCGALVFVVIGRRKHRSEQRRSNLSSETEAGVSLSVATDRRNSQGGTRLTTSTSAGPDHDTPACACSLFSPSFDVRVADQTSDATSPLPAASHTDVSLSVATDRKNAQGATRLAISSLFSPFFDVRVADQTSDTPSPLPAASLSVDRSTEPN